MDHDFSQQPPCYSQTLSTITTSNNSQLYGSYYSTIAPGAHSQGSVPPKPFCSCAEPSALPNELPALPNELLLMIGDNLSAQELSRLVLASRHMHALFNDNLYKKSVQTRGNFTLYWAAMTGEISVVRRVLALGSKPDEPCKHEGDLRRRFTSCMTVPETALLCAIMFNKLEVVKMLLDQGTDINRQGRAQENPLEYAVRVGGRDEHGRGRDEIVRMLLRRNADINQSSPRNVTALHSATVHKAGPESLEMIQLLLDSGADVNSPDEDLNTPLHNARDAETARLLIKHGANVNVVNRWDHTPLGIAVRAKDAAWARVLLEANADVNASNRKGETALFFISSSLGKDACVAGKSTDAEMTQLLLDHKASIHSLDRDGSTALHAICYDGDAATVSLLLKQGANASTRNRKGLTPIHIAAEEGWPDIVKMLIQQGANVNATNYYRSSPLHRMTSIPKRKLRPAGSVERYTEAMHVLLAEGANPNAQDRIGQTPLMKASYHGYWRFVGVLRDAKGIDLCVKDRRLKTAAQLAKDITPESRDLAKATADAMGEQEKEIEQQAGW